MFHFKQEISIKDIVNIKSDEMLVVTIGVTIWAYDPTRDRWAYLVR
jgi:hypothetical protein